ncbi:DUF4956 domain-containing protein, partial [Polaribacter sp.]|nr:DUF4956 domain-containing protein [Polaribacter sp.]
INSLANKKMSFSEILMANIIIVGSITVIERVWYLKHQVTKQIVYENIDNIRPENYNLLIQDLKDRTGLDVNKVDIGDIDFLKDTAILTIFYFNKK